ncbi:MAG: penicillin-binding transpeptidase domain-containing protein [Defluviitaleaceae bacterium]|nr:penicillin-binding transpeptidase domain-containing protein [Defluviitaleaceae bacterium]
MNNNGRRRPMSRTTREISRMARKARMAQLIERRRHVRAILMGLFFTACLGFLLYRIWYYQTVWGDEYSRLVAQQGARHQIGLITRDIAPSRGIITDRNLQPIASTRQVFTVFLDPHALHHRHRRDSSPPEWRDSRPEDYTNVKDDVLTAITRAFGHSRFDLDALFSQDFYGNILTTNRHFILSRGVLPEVAIPLTEMFPEIHANEESLRWHHDPFFAPQVLGFRWGDSLWGLESRYNRQLQGEHGRTVWIQGGEVEEVPVRDGFTLVTTFDADIQRLAQRHVDQAFSEVEARYVGMIVVNPHTLEILAMAQAPTFSLAEPMNPRYFTCHELIEQFEDLHFDRATGVMRLWRNFHTTRSSEPGSTFKPFVIAAAMEEGLINWNTTFYCEGIRQIHDRYVNCWFFTGHGRLTVSEALYRSCNLVMVDINTMLRSDTFYRYRGYFGFGHYTGIDIPGEWDVSHPAVMYPLYRLQLVEMATSAMGQGFNATTIQTINGYAALINGGNIMQPFFVSQIVDSQGVIVHQQEPVYVRRAISRQTSDSIRREMQLVVTADHATGRQLAIPGHSIGGKTGTAQQGPRDDYMASLTYVAFTPVENPEFLVLMTIDHIHAPRGSGVNAGNYVAPRLRRFFEELIRMRNIPPSEGDMAMPDWHIMMGSPTMPDYSGRRLADVVGYLNRPDSGGFQVVGSGTVISHHLPAPGAPMPENVPVIFHMDPNSRIDELMTFMPDVMNLPITQAEALLREMGLPNVTFTSAPTDRGVGDFSPHTASPGHLPLDGYHETPAPVQYVVYRQFPLAGTEIEMGTQVMLRTR